jgi:hypothetical protein
MKEITLKIGQLFDCLEDQGLDIKLNTFTKTPLHIRLPNEKDEWCKIPFVVKKEDDLLDIEFENGDHIKCGSKHLIGLNPDNNSDLIFAKDLSNGFEILYKGTKVKSITPIGAGFVYDLEIDSPSHLYKTSNGFIHHNTYTVKKAGERAIVRHPKGSKFVITSGDVGSAPSAVVYLLWKYREGYVLVLDDCDTMLKSKSQAVANLLKGALDPDVKPIAAGSFEVRKLVQKQLDADPDMNPYFPLTKKDWIKQQKEKIAKGEKPDQLPKTPNSNTTVNETPVMDGQIIDKTLDSLPDSKDIKNLEQDVKDADSLEDVLDIIDASNVEVVIPEEIKGETDSDKLKSILNILAAKEKEIEDLKSKKSKVISIPKQKQAKMVWDDKLGDFKLIREKTLANSGPIADELTDEEKELLTEPDLTPEQIAEMSEFDLPPTFTFKSSVIFISNLDFEQVNSAVRDRCLPAEIKLTREEFMVRLEAVLGGLCKEKPELSSLPQEKLDWAKKNCYTMLKSLIQAEKEKRPLGKNKYVPKINRQLTFRSIDDGVSIFLTIEKVLSASKPGFKDITDLNEKAKQMTGQYFIEMAQYLAQKSTA